MRIRAMLGLFAMTLGVPAVAQDAPGTVPGWMAGAWIERKGEDWSEEYWTAARGDLLLGAAKSGTGARLTWWEQTRIQRDPDGSIAFYASPRGQAPARFPMVAQKEGEIVFADPAHDYPQRIRYWRDGAMLRAEISKMDGSRVNRWAYVAMGR
jgi:hypothetical protein